MEAPRLHGGLSRDWPTALKLVFVICLSVLGFSRVIRGRHDVAQLTIPAHHPLLIKLAEEDADEPLRRLAFVLRNAPAVYLVSFQCLPRDFWVTASHLLLLIRFAAAVLLPIPLHKKMQSPVVMAQRSITHVCLLVMSLAYPMTEPSDLAVWYIRAAPIWDLLSCVFFPLADFSAEAMYGVLVLGTSGWLALRLSHLHPHLGLRLPSTILEHAVSTTLLLAFQVLRARVAARGMTRGAQQRLHRPSPHAQLDQRAAGSKAVDVDACAVADAVGRAGAAGAAGCSARYAGSADLEVYLHEEAQQERHEMRAPQGPKEEQLPGDRGYGLQPLATPRWQLVNGSAAAQGGQVAAAAAAGAPPRSVGSSSPPVPAACCGGSRGLESTGPPLPAPQYPRQGPEQRGAGAGGVVGQGLLADASAAATAAAAAATCAAHTILLPSARLINVNLSSRSNHHGAHHDTPPSLTHQLMQTVPVAEAGVQLPHTYPVACLAGGGAAATVPLLAAAAGGRGSVASGLQPLRLHTLLQPRPRYVRRTGIFRTAVKINGVEPEQVSAGWESRIAAALAERGLELEAAYLRRGCCELVVDAVVWHDHPPPPQAQPRTRRASADSSDGEAGSDAGADTPEWRRAAGSGASCSSGEMGALEDAGSRRKREVPGAADSGLAVVSVAAAAAAGVHRGAAADGGASDGGGSGSSALSSVDIGALIRALRLPYEGTVEYDVSYDLDIDSAAAGTFAGGSGHEVLIETADVTPQPTPGAVSIGRSDLSTAQLPPTDAIAVGGDGDDGSDGAACAILAVWPRVLYLPPQAPLPPLPQRPVQVARLLADIWTLQGDDGGEAPGEDGGGSSARPEVLVRSQGRCLPLSVTFNTRHAAAGHDAEWQRRQRPHAHRAVAGDDDVSRGHDVNTPHGAADAAARAAAAASTAAAAATPLGLAPAVTASATALAAAAAVPFDVATAEVGLLALPELPGLLLVEARMGRQARCSVLPVLLLADPWVVAEMSVLAETWMGTPSELHDVLMDLGCFAHHAHAAARVTAPAGCNAAATGEEAPPDPRTAGGSPGSGALAAAASGGVTPSSAVGLSGLGASSPPSMGCSATHMAAADGGISSLLRARLLDLGAHLTGWFCSDPAAWPHTLAWLEAAVLSVGAAPIADDAAAINHVPAAAAATSAPEAAVPTSVAAALRTGAPHATAAPAAAVVPAVAGPRHAATVAATAVETKGGLVTASSSSADAPTFCDIATDASPRIRTGATSGGGSAQEATEQQQQPSRRRSTSGTGLLMRRLCGGGSGSGSGWARPGAGVSAAEGSPSFSSDAAAASAAAAQEEREYRALVAEFSASQMHKLYLLLLSLYAVILTRAWVERCIFPPIPSTLPTSSQSPSLSPFPSSFPSSSSASPPPPLGIWLPGLIADLGPSLVAVLPALATAVAWPLLRHGRWVALVRRCMGLRLAAHLAAGVLVGYLGMVPSDDAAKGYHLGPAVLVGDGVLYLGTALVDTHTSALMALLRVPVYVRMWAAMGATFSPPYAWARAALVSALSVATNAACHTLLRAMHRRQRRTAAAAAAVDAGAKAE